MRKKKRLRPLGGVLLLAAVVFGGWLVMDRLEALGLAGVVSHTAKTTVTVRETDIHSGNLILINPQYEYRFAGGDDLVSVYGAKNTAYMVKDKNVLLDATVIKALNDMMAQFNRVYAGNDVNVISGYRTAAEQQNLLRNEIALKGREMAALWVAKPGYSEHHSGLALDLGLCFDNGTSAQFDGTGKYAWVLQNCWTYGFIVRYPESKQDVTKIAYEPWHLRYVGVPHAVIMQEKGLCLEEYIDMLRGYLFEKKHLEVTVQGATYEIYFTAKTDVPVPKRGTYTVSGNNVDGFIVTAEK